MLRLSGCQFEIINCEISKFFGKTLAGRFTAGIMDPNIIKNLFWKGGILNAY